MHTMPDGDEVIPGIDPADQPTRRAGLRPEERDPDEPRRAAGSAGGPINMAGTPAGGSARGGLAGTNLGDGSLDEADKIDAGFGAGVYDDSGDRRFVENEPAAGSAGGAVGGTPANKRAEPSTIGRGINPASGGRGGDGSTIGSDPTKSPTRQ
jgi:hypothetical protein